MVKYVIVNVYSFAEQDFSYRADGSVSSIFGNLVSNLVLFAGMLARLLANMQEVLLAKLLANMPATWHSSLDLLYIM